MGDPPGPAPAAELTGRALAAGALVGALLAVGNVYMGLKTGWWDSGSITASILSFGLLSAWARVSGSRPTPLENNIAQTLAAAVGASPAAAGLLGALPALALLGGGASGPVAAALGMALGVLGILAGLALRRRLLEEEELPFPTGVATAEVIRALHGGRGGAGASVLAATGTAAAAATALRDVWGLVPQATALPGRLAGAPASAYTLGFAWSPMMLGAGLVAGPRNGLGVLLGAAAAWGVVAPALVRSGAVEAAGYAPLVGWLVWPGVGLMLGSAAISLGAQARTFSRALRDLASVGGSRGGRSAGPALLALAGAAAAAAACWAAFGLSPLHAAGALALAALLAAVCARSAGQADIIPAGDVGQLTQVAAGAAGASSAAATLGAGQIAAGAAAQAGVTLWSLRAGRNLGASPRRQAVAMLLGAAAGSALAVPVYLLLSGAYGLGTPALPAPGAMPWKAVASALAGGAAALPPGALAAALGGLAAGALLELASRRRAGRFLPAAGALGVGFVVPFVYASAIAAGALGGAAYRAARPDRADAALPVVGAGAIAGESLAGFAVAALGALGLVALRG